MATMRQVASRGRGWERGGTRGGRAMHRRVAWRVLQAATVAMGAAWAWGLMWAGCVAFEQGADAVWLRPLVERSPWVVPLAGWLPWSMGLFVWMFLVCDTVCPRGGSGVGAFMKMVTAMLFWSSLIGTLIAGWRMLGA